MPNLKRSAPPRPGPLGSNVGNARGPQGIQGVPGPIQMEEAYQDSFPIPGPQGNKGDQGVAGPQGLFGFGLDGDQGEMDFGVPGPPGPQGPSGNPLAVYDYYEDKSIASTGNGTILSRTVSLVSGIYAAWGSFIVMGATAPGNTGGNHWGTVYLRYGGVALGSGTWASADSSNEPNLGTRQTLSKVFSHGGGNATVDIFYQGDNGNQNIYFSNSDARFCRALLLVRIGS